MNILLNRHLSRRALLRGVAITLALSFLDVIHPVLGPAAAVAKPHSTILAAFVHARGADITFPADAKIRNVKSEFGAKGNGTTDDTAAIQKAFDSCQQKHMEVVYFPIGTYLVSKPVHFRGWMFVQGENRDKTIIKLQDKCPGYGDVKTPNWLLATTDPMLPEKRPGGDNMAFSNHVMNLTLDVGTGNPAAIGVQFISHNGGGLEDVTIRSADAGLIGLDLRTPWNGPCLFQRVRIEGFDVGIESWHQTYFSTFENIHLQGQKTAGWVNDDHPLVVRKLVSENAVPAIVNSKANGHFVMLDSELNGGGKEAVAIDNEGGLFLRNVKTTGYAAAVRHKGKTLPGKIVEEYVSGEPVVQHPSPKKTLNLPVEETPDIRWDDHKDWANVLDYKPQVITLWTTDHNDTGYDAADAVQAAIDSGKSTVYFPHGTYILRKSIVIRGKVKVIQGCGSYVLLDREMIKENAAIVLGDTDAKTVFLDRISLPQRFPKDGQFVFEHRGTADLVVTHTRWLTYRNGERCGRLFADDLCGAPLLFEYPQKVWLRGLNCEMGQGLKIDNRAADLWIMGYKAEGVATELRNGKLARTELLGGLLYPAGGDLEMNPSFFNDGGRMSLVHSMFWANRQYIHDTWKGTTKKHRTEERFMHLYVTNPEK